MTKLRYMIKQFQTDMEKRFVNFQCHAIIKVQYSYNSYLNTTKVDTEMQEFPVPCL
mgnify:FL=1